MKERNSLWKRKERVFLNNKKKSKKERKNERQKERNKERKNLKKNERKKFYMKKERKSISL